MFEDIDRIRMHDRTKPMSDDHRHQVRARVANISDCVSYLFFNQAIQCTRSFIEDQDLWITQQCTSDSKTLSLTT